MYSIENTDRRHPLLIKIIQLEFCHFIVGVLDAWCLYKAELSAYL